MHEHNTDRRQTAGSTVYSGIEERTAFGSDSRGSRSGTCARVFMTRGGTPADADALAKMRSRGRMSTFACLNPRRVRAGAATAGLPARGVRGRPHGGERA